jgi:hypothetical protein
MPTWISAGCRLSRHNLPTGADNWLTYVTIPSTVTMNMMIMVAGLFVIGLILVVLKIILL